MGHVSVTEQQRAHASSMRVTDRTQHVYFMFSREAVGIGKAENRFRVGG